MTQKTWSVPAAFDLSGERRVEIDPADMPRAMAAADVDLEQVHEDLARAKGCPDFAGVSLVDGRLVLSFTCKPPKGELAAATALLRAHRTTRPRKPRPPQLEEVL